MLDISHVRSSSLSNLISTKSRVGCGAILFNTNWNTSMPLSKLSTTRHFSKSSSHKCLQNNITVNYYPIVSYMSGDYPYNVLAVVFSSFYFYNI